MTTVKASPAVSTSASKTADGVVGTSVLSDSATVTGGFNPTGTITFTVTAPDGTTSPVGSPVPVSGDGTYNAPATVPATEVGTYTWHASYSGDSLNNGAIAAGTNESVTTVKASPAVSTSASKTADGVVGTSVLSDSATVTGGFNPTGTITFTVTAPDGTTSPVGSPVPVSGDGTYNAPATVPATEVGTYTWHASYSGDSLNNGAIAAGTNESVTTVKASPAVSTSASKTADGVVGTSVLSDSATVTGGFNPTGTITFTVTAPDGTTSPVGSPVPVSGDGTYNAPATVPATEVGTYTWHASYSGDSLNNGAIAAGTNESVTTVKASPAVSTSASKTADGVVGTSVLSDSATVTGGFNPTGTITFTVTAPDGTTSPVGSPVPVSGDGTYNAPATVPATEVGTYTWHASYSGDSLNNGAIAAGTNESVTTVKASPAVSTTANPTGTIYAGTTAPTLSDSAVLAGGYNVAAGTPAPTITFTLYLGANSSGTQVYSTTVPVTGDGTYTASTSSETATGLYTWVVTYSGNAFNNTAHDQGDAAEQVTINDQVATNTSATKGFWSNNNGAALLGTYGTALGNWLATTYPNLFGNLNGATGVRSPRTSPTK